MTTRRTLTLDGLAFETTYTRKFADRKPYRPKDPGRLTALIPGVVLEVLVPPGETVRRGQGVLVIEAMKMQNEVAAPIKGQVLALHVAVGETVVKGQLLLTLQPAPDTL